MKVMSLFAGIGGFDLAARWMGWESKVMVEWDAYCQKVLHKNFPEAEIHGDITKFDATPYLGSIDLVCGGFPCQPYSSAGKRLGKEDDRHLWPEMLRIIKEVQPRWVVGENVSGILNWSEGMVVHEVLSDLEGLNYETIPPINLPAAGVKAPHERQRVWFVGYNNQIKSSAKRTISEGSNTQPDRICERVITHSSKVGLDAPNEKWVSDDRAKQAGQQRIKAIGSENRESIGMGHLQNALRGRGFDIGQWDSWYAEPLLLGVDDGIPAGLDDAKRIGALGNAIVPQVVYQLFQAIQHIETHA